MAPQRGHSDLHFPNNMSFPTQVMMASHLLLAFVSCLSLEVWFNSRVLPGTTIIMGGETPSSSIPAAGTLATPPTEFGHLSPTWMCKYRRDWLCWRTWRPGASLDSRLAMFVLGCMWVCICVYVCAYVVCICVCVCLSRGPCIHRGHCVYKL